MAAHPVSYGEQTQRMIDQDSVLILRSSSAVRDGIGLDHILLRPTSKTLQHLRQRTAVVSLAISKLEPLAVKRVELCTPSFQLPQIIILTSQMTTVRLRHNVVMSLRSP